MTDCLVELLDEDKARFRATTPDGTGKLLMMAEEDGRYTTNLARASKYLVKIKGEGGALFRWYRPDECALEALN